MGSGEGSRSTVCTTAMIASAASAAAFALRPPAEVRSAASVVVAVQDLGGDPRVVGEPLRCEDRQAAAPNEQETLAGERVQDTGVAEACGVAHRHDRRTNVKVVAVCLRQGVDRYCPVWLGRVGEGTLPRQGLEQRERSELERVEWGWVASSAIASTRF